MDNKCERCTQRDMMQSVLLLTGLIIGVVVAGIIVLELFIYGPRV